MSSQTLTPNTESAILVRILQAGEQDLTPKGARYWLSVKLPDSDQDRVDELSANARAGSLTEAATQELDNYLHIGFLIGTMQAKGRQLLKMLNLVAVNRESVQIVRERAGAPSTAGSAIGAAAPLSSRPYYCRRARWGNCLGKPRFRLSSLQSL
jgi:hypothetical protein